MSAREQLNLYIERVEQRLRLGAILRGAAILTAVALTVTVVLVLIANAFAFSAVSLTASRVALFLAMGFAVTAGLALPLQQLNRRKAVGKAEGAFPQFQQRLVTFAERDNREPFIELLASDTLEVARGAEPAALLPDKSLILSVATGIVSLAVLVWMIVAGPGFLGYGAALLWTGPHAPPLYDIHVTPGDATVRRNSDQLVTAKIVGVQTDNVKLYSRYKTTSKWEPVAMQGLPGTAGFQFLFAGLPEDVEYYVEAGALHSRHFNIHVADLPSVKQIKITYHYPPWTGLKSTVEDHGGDLRAIQGTQADLEILMDRPLHDGLLALDNDQQIHLSGGEGNLYRGSIHMDKDGAYHVAAVDQGQPARLSEDFFIEASKAKPPEVVLSKPGRDYQASPIEEVTVAVKADDDFGLNDFSLHYSINGGEEQTINMLKRSGEKTADGSTVIHLEDFKVVPGDIVSLYAIAKDARSESRTDMFFIQAEPFEREFSQSQQSGGGGGGGGGGNQAEISQREKEIIAATWKQLGNPDEAQQKPGEAAKFLSGVQSKLRDQALSLSGRLQMRDLTQQNQEFSDFQKDMTTAAAAMAPATERLQQLKWKDALRNEQTALQYLLRAEATFRQIQVAFGNGGGGGGGGGSAGRDLASLFDLELDTQKNQYETGQNGSSSASQRDQAIDDALKKLDELARRQEELAAQQRNSSAQTFQQRWQQEILRRDAEELQRQLDQLSKNNQQGNSQSGQSGQSGGQSSSGQSSNGQSGGGQQSGNGQSSGSSGSSGSGGQSADSRAQQAANQLRQANDDMRRAASEPQSSADARRAADRLRQAQNLLGGVRSQEASGNLDALSQEASRLSKEESDQANRMRQLPGRSGNPYSRAGSPEQSRLADDRQRLADDLSRLQKNMRDAQRGLASSNRPAATKLRDALGELDSADVGTLIQRGADSLRRGITSDPREPEISAGLQRLTDEMQQAKTLSGQQQGDSTQSALNQVQNLRDRLEALDRNFSGRENRGGQQGTENRGGQYARNGSPNQGNQGNQNGPLSRSNNGGNNDGNGGGNQGGGNRDGGAYGDIGNRNYGGNNGGNYGGGPIYGNFDTGNNSNLPQPANPDRSPIPADSERTFQQGMSQLNQLRQTVQEDPEMLRQVQELIREMQRLDPSRFPGNPALVAQLHTQVLNDVDKLELQLRRKADESDAGQIRSSAPLPVPSGYQESVAEYFRRLSNLNKKNP